MITLVLAVIVLIFYWICRPKSVNIGKYVGLGAVLVLIFSWVAVSIYCMSFINT